MLKGCSSHPERKSRHQHPGKRRLFETAGRIHLPIHHQRFIWKRQSREEALIYRNGGSALIPKNVRLRLFHPGASIKGADFQSPFRLVGDFKSPLLGFLQSQRGSCMMISVNAAMSLTEDEVRFRPFELLRFSPPVAGSVSNSDVDAHAALQSRLAQDGVESITPTIAIDLLAGYGVTPDRARKILIELWQHAFKKLLFRDDVVDTGEAAYLEKLKAALGLSDDEVTVARSEVPKIEPPSAATTAEAS